MESSHITIRPMRQEEKSQVRAIMQRAFSLPVSLFFSWAGHVLVAEQEGRLLGGIVLRTFPLPGGGKGGEVAWVFTDLDARGLGAGHALVEGGLNYLDAEGCDEIFACVEGNNSSSFKLFATRGFSILSPGEQFRRYGLRTFLVWVRTTHFSDVGHFLWARPPEQGEDSPGLQWWGGLLVNALLALLAWWRRHSFDPLGGGPGGLGSSAAAAGALAAALVLLFGVRHLAMLGTGALQGLRLRYRAWESTLPTTLIIGLVFGAFFPAPGGLYPEGDDWRYGDLLPRLGPMGLAGSLAVLLLAWGAWVLQRFASLALPVQGWLATLLFVAVPLSLCDTVLAFFPFTGFNGRRLWDWSRPLWLLLSLAAVGLLFVR